MSLFGPIDQDPATVSGACEDGYHGRCSWDPCRCRCRCHRIIVSFDPGPANDVVAQSRLAMNGLILQAAASIVTPHHRIERIIEP